MKKANISLMIKMALGGVLASSGVAFGQDSQTSDLSLEKITVTAQRKEESIQSSPVSISALGPEDIERLQIDNTKDLSQVMPNVMIKGVTGGSAGITPFIRGGGVTDGALITSEPEVGIYIDDVYQPRSAASFIESLELERIEVLRGPQGTLYGRNSSSGALKIISRVPDDLFRFKNEVGIGSWNEIYDKFSISGPLSDDEKLRGGITGMLRKRDGGRQYNATLDKEVGEEDYAGFQGDLFYEGETYTARWKYFYTNYESDGLYASSLDPFQVDNEYDQIPFTSGEFDTVLSPFESSTEDKQYGTSVHLTKQISDSMKLLSVTSWSKLQNDWSTGFSGGVANALLGIEGDGYVELFSRDSVSDQNSFSQELQLQGEAWENRVSYIAGLYYFNESGEQIVNSTVFFAPSYGDFDIDTKSYAVFGQANVNLTDKLGLIVGARYTRDEKSLDATLETSPVNREDTFKKFTPKVALNYQANDDLLLYTSYTEGFKAGGYNSLASTPEGLNTPFEMQVMDAYEAGLKSEWWNNRLRINVAGFFNEYSSLQQQSVDEFGSFITENYDAEHKGIEVELNVRLTSNLNLWANGVSQDSEYTAVSVNGVSSNGGLVGNKMTNVFEFQYAAGLDYTQDIGDGTLMLGTNVNHRDDYYSTADNSEIGHIEPVTLIDAYAAYAYERWKFTLSGKNLGNEKYAFTGFGFSLIQPRFMADPMTWRLSVSYEL
ncbi:MULTISPECIES: TonB-dependent receptor [Aliiglaciecola]|uniref:TonB-dependent receptor n=1 Tax=Aliiglaciecola TaxID=1406885 RepID=UPI001C0A3CA4|nr:TonB-dependent receptor [Aliiglaciecola lipolytica]MBU2879031.1 TonB-dependent receptor [Aliiglaciecola lipolytica]